MKNKKIIILLIIALIVVLFLLMNRTSEFKIDSENKYLITTNMSMLTMENDGGTHTNIYYGLDLDKKKVYKYQDSYKGFEGYEYKGKIVNRKSLNDTEINSLKQLINEIISNNGQAEETIKFYMAYTLTTKNNGDIKIYDKDIISKLEDLLN